MNEMCQKALDMMLDSQQLSEPEEVFLNEHINQCDTCHQEFEMIREFANQFDGIETPVPTGLADQVLAAVAEEDAEEQRPTGILAGLGIACAAMFAAILGLEYGVPTWVQMAWNKTSAVDPKAQLEAVLASVSDASFSVRIPDAFQSVPWLLIAGAAVAVIAFSTLTIYQVSHNHAK